MDEYNWNKRYSLKELHEALYGQKRIMRSADGADEYYEHPYNNPRDDDADAEYGCD